MSTTAGNIDKSRLTEPVAAVEAYLEQVVRERPFPRNLTDAIAYSVLGGGKRMRPILTVRACEAVGGSRDAAMPPAAAIELIHCFSLVHDDLPAMDDDDLRRGRPTLHKHANEAMAILAGDAMTALAFEVIASRVASADIAARLTLELSTATNDMIAGQVYDTLPDFDDSVEPIDRLRTTHRHKTGALIRCACRMGAIVARADDAALDAVTCYAEAIGLMFQVVDDVLDVTQTTEQLGKTAGKDVEQGKLTYPALIGIEASRDEIKRLQHEAHAAVEALGAAADPLRELCDYLAVRSN